MSATVRSLLAASLSFAFACTPDVIVGVKDGNPNEPLANIEVEPRLVEFGTQTTADAPTETITITNVGSSTLGVDELRLEGPASFTVDFAELPWDLAPDEARTFEVTFRPLDGGKVEGRIVVLSNADDEPEVPVALAGFGAVPDLQISPDPMEMGDAFIPCEVERKFTLTNMGPEPVVVTSVTLGGNDASQISLPFSVPSGLTLRKNQPYDVPIVMAPDRAVPVDAELIVESTDPKSPQRVPITGNPRFPRTVVETWDVPEQLPLELVFAVDKSCSMSDDAARLAQNVQGFVAALQSAKVDWRIGVTTGIGACFDTILTSATPDWSTVFSNAVNGGFGGAYTESLVEAVGRSLWWNGAMPACNQALSGPDGTPVHIVLISDEYNQSSPPPATITGAPQWKSWLDLYYRAYAGPNATLRVHSIVDVTADGRGCDGDSNPDDGPGDYLQIASATGGYGLNLCSANWSTSLAQIAQQAVADLSEYRIKDNNVRRGAEQPADGSLVVTYDGVPQTTGWSLAPDGKSLVFDPIPPAGTHVEISFGIAFSCP